MKKLLPLLLLSLLGFNETKAQYHPMLGDTTKWCLAWNMMVVRSADSRAFENNYYEAMTDTIYDSTSYKKVFDDYGYYGAMREDTSAQQVFLIKAGDTVEHLLYDYSLSLGNLFLVDLMNNFSGNMNDGFYTVDSVGTAIINGGPRKYIRLHNPANTMTGGDGKPLKLEWIESVGDIHNLMYTYAYDAINYTPMGFACNNYHDGAVMKQTIDGTKNYLDMCTVMNVGGTIDADTCDIVYWGSVEELNNQIQLSVFPNPTNGNYITIDVNNFTLKGNCIISVNDASGRNVYSKSVSPIGNSIKVENIQFENGIYFVSLSNGKDNFGKVKLVVEK